MTAPIIDTHLHLVYRDRLRYPWLASTPKLDRDFSLQHYLAEASALGIGEALHMEVDVATADQEVETAFVTGLRPLRAGPAAAHRDPPRARLP